MRKKKRNSLQQLHQPRNIGELLDRDSTILVKHYLANGEADAFAKALEMVREHIGRRILCAGYLFGYLSHRILTPGFELGFVPDLLTVTVPTERSKRQITTFLRSAPFAYRLRDKLEVVVVPDLLKLHEHETAGKFDTVLAPNLFRFIDPTQREEMALILAGTLNGGGRLLTFEVFPDPADFCTPYNPFISSLHIPAERTIHRILTALTYPLSMNELYELILRPAGRVESTGFSSRPIPRPAQEVLSMVSVNKAPPLQFDQRIAQTDEHLIEPQTFGIAYSVHERKKH